MPRPFALAATALAAGLALVAGPVSVSAQSSAPLVSSLGTASSGLGTPAPAPPFDLQAHRGGLGLHTESSPHSFSHALEMGVSTLELDTQVTRDGAVVVTHDRQTNPAVCRDTAPVSNGDPQFPYLGKWVKDLTLEQLRTLDCGSVQREGHPGQQTHPGSRMMLLSEVFDLVKAHKAWTVRMNVETKVEAGAPEETAPREEFVRRVHAEIARSGLARQVTVQSFDWGALRVMHELDPTLPLVALTNGDFLEVGREGASPWLGGLDVDDFDGDGVRAATAIPGVVAYSPVATAPQSCSVADSGCEPYVTAEMVRTAHERDVKVIPWTVNDVATMTHLMDLGVDGIITDRPDRLREVMAERGLPLPTPFPRP